jgi:hypothetical protein
MKIFFWQGFFLKKASFVEKRSPALKSASWGTLPSPHTNTPALQFKFFSGLHSKSTVEFGDRNRLTSSSELSNSDNSSSSRSLNYLDRLLTQNR